jgi:PAS domain S-box-containing protein
MEDEDKTKEQIICELTSLRQRVAELEGRGFERNLREEALRKSEAKYHNIFEHAPMGIFRSTVKGKFVEANPAVARIQGYDSLEDMIAMTNRTSIAETLYVDPEARSVIVKKALDSNGGWVEGESRQRRKDGDIIDVRFFFRKVPMESGESDLLEGFGEDISEQKRLEFLLRLQRDIALALGSTSSMDEAMEQLLQSVMQMEGIDAGGVYLLDAPNEKLRLASHVGLSSWFIDEVSHYGPETPHMCLVMQGEPVYRRDVSDTLGIGDLLEREGITALAVVPIKSKGQVVGVLNLASRTQNEFHEWTKKALESIAAGIGGLVSRAIAEDALRMERESLADANAALKVLVKQWEENRRELEETLLTNVESLVTPCVEKLKKTRLTPDQALLLDIVDSKLKEITSPFLPTLSRRFADLTPMEIRVASLIREGKSSKETAHILGVSLEAVLFHRQNLRGKLGLKGEKTNLESYLASLRGDRF